MGPGETWGDLGRPGEIFQVSSRVRSVSLAGRLILSANSNNSETSFISSPLDLEILTEKLLDCQPVGGGGLHSRAGQLDLVASSINMITLHLSLSSLLTRYEELSGGLA